MIQKGTIELMSYTLRFECFVTRGGAISVIGSQWV